MGVCPGLYDDPHRRSLNRRRPSLIPPRSHDPYPGVPVRNPRLLHHPGRSGAAVACTSRMSFLTLGATV
jgi:hypothetical protein